MSLWTTPTQQTNIQNRLGEIGAAHRQAGIRGGVRTVQAVPRQAQAQGGPRDNVRRVGAADNPTIFNALVSGGGLMPCVFQHLDVAPFTPQLMRGEGFQVQHLAVIGVISALRMERAADLQARQQIIAEALAPNYPLQQCLPVDAARAELNRVLNNTERLRDSNWFMEIARRIADAGRVGGVYNIDTNTWQADTTLEQKLGLILMIINHVDCTERMRCMYAVFILLISFATRGNLSGEKSMRIMEDMRGQMPTLVQMFRIEDVRLTYMNFGQYIDDETAHVVIGRWLHQVPQCAVRLRVLLAQTAGSGLTSLDMIARAIHEHPGFLWPQVALMYPTQWENVHEAFRAVGGRIYYGFRADLGDVRASRFYQITWVAHTLLVEAGDEALKRYKGIKKDTRQERVVQDMVREYLVTRGGETDHLAGKITAEQLAAFEETLGLVRRHPSVVMDLAVLTGHGAARVDIPGDGAQADHQI